MSAAAPRSLRHDGSTPHAGLRVMERTGIEPVTSGLQSVARASPPAPVSPRSPANWALLPDARPIPPHPCPARLAKDLPTILLQSRTAAGFSPTPRSGRERQLFPVCESAARAPMGLRKRWLDDGRGTRQPLVAFGEARRTRAFARMSIRPASLTLSSARRPRPVPRTIFRRRASCLRGDGRGSPRSGSKRRRRTTGRKRTSSTCGRAREIVA